MSDDFDFRKTAVFKVLQQAHPLDEKTEKPLASVYARARFCPIIRLPLYKDRRDLLETVRNLSSTGTIVHLFSYKTLIQIPRDTARETSEEYLQWFGLPRDFFEIEKDDDDLIMIWSGLAAYN